MNAMKVCVVGAGPAGMYLVQHVMRKMQKLGQQVLVDVIDRRPVPGGLARYGVAPDHAASVSGVLKTIDKVLEEDTVRFFGNVQVDMNGHKGNINLHELRALYDAVVLAHGADNPNWLGIEGEDKLRNRGVTTARHLVAWYCGDPMTENSPFPFSSKGNTKVTDAAVIGAGNVALDVARMLLTPIPVLEKETDIAERFLNLRENMVGIDRIHIFARRGPRAAAFAPKELREILSKDFIKTKIVIPERKDSIADGVNPFDMDVSVGSMTRAQRRVFKLLKDHYEKQDLLDDTKSNSEKELWIHFLSKPVKFEGKEWLEGLEIEKQTEICKGDSQVTVVATEGEAGHKSEILPAQIAIVAAGQKSSLIDGLGQREHLSVPRVAKRSSDVQGSTTRPLAPVYVSGWAYHGAKGIIASSLHDAEEVSAQVVEDLAEIDIVHQNRNDIENILLERGVNFMTYKDWSAIDKEQQARGLKSGRPLERIAKLDDIFKLAAASAA